MLHALGAEHVTATCRAGSCAAEPDFVEFLCFGEFVGYYDLNHHLIHCELSETH